MASCPENFNLPKPNTATPPIKGCPQEFSLSEYKNDFITLRGQCDSLRNKTFTSFREFIWELIFKYQLNELQKAYTIFYWITVTDLPGLQFTSDPKPKSPEEVIAKYKNDELESFAQIFKLICRYSGLPCEVVPGHAKGLRYLPGMRFANTPPNHYWNAVFVKNEWNLVDCQWATRYMSTLDDRQNGKMVFELDDNYFFMYPAKAIYSHLPAESKWQLLGTLPNVSLETFEMLPMIKNQYFMTRMEILNDFLGVLHTKDGLLSLTMTYAALAEFLCRLDKYENKELVESSPNFSYQNYVLLETNNESVTVFLRLPEKGEYFLTLFNKIIVRNQDLDSNEFRALCMFKIICDEPCDLSLRPYIGFCDTNFGPCWPLMIYYGITSVQHNTGVICMDARNKPFLFECSFELKDPTVTLLAKFRTTIPSYSYEPPLSPYVDDMVQERKSGTRITYSVNLEEEGEYVLEVYANKSTDSSDSYTHICQYFIDFKSKPDDFIVQLPKADNGKSWSQQGLPNPYKTLPGTRSRCTSPVAESLERFHSPSPKPKSPVYRKMPRTTPTPVEVKSEENSVSRREREALMEKLRAVAIATNTEFIDLVMDLVYSKRMKTDSEKVRALFLWLVSKNLDTDVTYEMAEPKSPEEMLLKLKRCEVSYADVFSILCMYIFIENKVIYGYAKGSGYDANVALDQSTQSLHSWNAALVDSLWYLFDCDWAARRALRKDYNQLSANYDIDDYYYMPDPNQLKLSHHPHEEKWQLTTAPLTFDVFKSMTAVKPAYFKYELELISHPQALIECTPPSINIKIGVPVKYSNSLMFGFHFSRKGKGGAVNSENYDNFGIHELIKNEHPTVSYTFRFASPGKFRVALLVKAIKEPLFSVVCCYDIVVSPDPRPDAPAVVSFPITLYKGYGPTEFARPLGILCSSERSVISGIQTRADMEFHMRSRELPLLSMQVTLLGLKQTPAELAGFVFTREFIDSEGKEKYVITVQPPKEGEFAVQVFGRPNFETVEDPKLIWQFLLQTAPGFVAKPMPIKKTQHFGATEDFYKHSLVASSHMDPFIPYKMDLASVGPLKMADVQVVFQNTSNLFLTGQLLAFNFTMTGKDVSEYLLQQTYEHSVSFLIRFPNSGWFRFDLFGVPKNKVSDSDRLPLLYSYILKSDLLEGAPSMEPFPTQTIQWKQGCVLNEPLNGDFNRTTKSNRVKFSLITPVARDVVVVYSNKMFHLECNLEQAFTNATLWEGFIPIPETPPSKVEVLSKSEDTLFGQYTSLLQYLS